MICLEHHQQIKNALGIGGMATSVSTWRHNADKESGKQGGQVDMVIERADRIIHLFEIKFSTKKIYNHKRLRKEGARTTLAISRGYEDHKSGCTNIYHDIRTF